MTTWNEALHPRQGGKFAKKGTAPASSAKPAAGKGGTGGGKGKDGSGSEGLSYNGRTGAGYGKKGGDKRVSTLQTQLNRLGLTDARGNKLVVDGKLGPRTTAAIKKAQRALGMKADGVATPGLLAKLRDLKDIKGAKQVGAKKTAVPVKGKGKKPAPTKKTVPARPGSQPPTARPAPRQSPSHMNRKPAPMPRSRRRTAS